jgi:CubicO group peptidase (beta-lactamase class C family)
MNIQLSNEKVDNIFSKYRKSGAPGCALAIIKDGEILYKQGYGLANLESEQPFLPSTVFNIGSTAKQFTGFSIALLEDQGKLSFEDDIRQYLPEMNDFGSTITIRHLLHHTSGIRDTFPELLGLAEFRESDVVTQDDVFRLLQKQRDLDFPTGTEFAYANSNYILLALICERVSGSPFATFCKEQIFDPLGMTQTVIFDNPWKVVMGKAAAYYEEGEGDWSNALLTDAVMGSTNVYSSVEDLALWDENFYTGKVGGKTVAEKMHQPGRLDDGTILDYAFGLEVGPNHTHRGWQLVEHGGGHGGYCNHMVRFPELHFSVVVLFNHFLWNSRDYSLQVADLYVEDNPNLQKESESPKQVSVSVEVSEEILAAKAGKYFNSKRAALRQVTFSEGRLKYEGLDLVPMSDNRFYFEEVPDIQVEFAASEDGTASGVTTFTPSGDYSYKLVEVVIPKPDDLNAYEGRYYSPELDLYWTITLEGDNLVVRRRKYADSALSPLFTDAFSDDWSSIVGYPLTFMIIFDRDQRGEITGLKVSGSRVRNLRFVRQGD